MRTDLQEDIAGDISRCTYEIFSGGNRIHKELIIEILRILFGIYIVWHVCYFMKPSGNALSTANTSGA